jgi:hypothetical protein
MFGEFLDQQGVFLCRLCWHGVVMYVTSVPLQGIALYVLWWYDVVMLSMRCVSQHDSTSFITSVFLCIVTSSIPLVQLLCMLT